MQGIIKNGRSISLNIKTIKKAILHIIRNNSYSDYTKVIANFRTDTQIKLTMDRKI